MRKLRTIVRLDHIRSISETGDRSLHKINCTATVVLLVGKNESFSAGFFKHGVLIECFTICSHITGCGHIFHIHLPFFAQFCGCIIVFRMFVWISSAFLRYPSRTNTRYREPGCLLYAFSRRSRKFISPVCRYGFTEFTFVVTSCGNYLLSCFLFCVTIPMTIETSFISFGLR